MEDETESKALLSGFSTQEEAELQSFRSCLKWLCLDHSNIWRTTLSFSIFFLLSIGVPLASHFLFSCSSCDEKHRRPYDALVQFSLSVFATLSFVSLSFWAHKYGLKRFIFLDKFCDVRENVRYGYTEQLHKSMKLLSVSVLPCFTILSAYKIWWFISGSNQLPFYGNIYISNTIACTLQLCSWLYRTSIFFLVCLLYRLICYLQILRMEDFTQVFQKETDVGSILKEHLRLRRNLRIISHRFRAFVLLTLVLVTANQLASLLCIIRSRAIVNVFKAAELALSSISLVTGLFICLRSATKITHKAQSVASLAAKWHACATINSSDNVDSKTPTAQITSHPQPRIFPVINGDYWESDDDEEGDGDDNIDNTKMMPIFAHTISFQKRQALVAYLENNRAGITVFGFMLDRTWLHTIFGIELSLLLWLLNKTIGLS